MRGFCYRKIIPPPLKTGYFLVKKNSCKGRFQKTKQKMVGFIQRSSDPSQPGRALDKKNSKITHFFYVFIIYIITEFGENFE